MKNLILFLFPLVVFAFVSCADNGTVPQPPEPLSREDSIKTALLKTSTTKEPYILLKDAGLEAELIAQGLDTDNLINGRIAQEDADKIEFFGKPLRVEVGNPDDSDFYSSAFYYRHHAVMPILKRDYKEKTGSELIVKELSDVNSFKNLRKLYVTFDTETIDSLNLSANENLELFETYDTRIRIIDFDGCKSIKKIHFMRSPHPLAKTNILDKIYISQCSKLEYLSFVGKKLKDLDISQNTHLKHLEIQGMSAPLETKIEKLDLCNHPYLEYLSVPWNYYKRVSLESSVFAFYETSKLQNIPNGFPSLNYGGEVRVCE